MYPVINKALWSARYMIAIYAIITIIKIAM